MKEMESSALGIRAAKIYQGDSGPVDFPFLWELEGGEDGEDDPRARGEGGFLAIVGGAILFTVYRRNR